MTDNTTSDFPAANSNADPVPFMDRAAKLTPSTPAEEYNQLFADIADSGLDEIQVDKILEICQKQLATKPRVIRKAYNHIKAIRLKAPDLGLKIAQACLEQYYGNGTLLRQNTDGSYFVYDATHWRPTNPEVIRQSLQKTASQYLASTKKTLSALVGEANACLKDMLATDFDVVGLTEKQARVINCQNVELWLKEDGTFISSLHQPTSELFSCLNITYDPAATCPKYDQSVLEIFSESSNPAEMVRHFEELAGYAISAQRNIAMFFLLIGEGSNGKSSLLETLQRLVGVNSVLSSSLAAFQKDNFSISSLQGKLLFVDDDLKKDIVLNDELMKKLSEYKLLSARHAYGKRKFNFYNTALPILASNTFPSTNDVSEGMIRRTNVIPFDHKFGPGQVDLKRFPYIWENEMSGVLNRALAGLQRLHERGSFLEPADCVRAREEFLEHANPLIAFLAKHTQPDPEAVVKTKDLREFFRAWLQDQGYPSHVKTHKFVAELRSLAVKFGFKVDTAEEAKKTAYPKIYGRQLIIEV